MDSRDESAEDGSRTRVDKWLWAGAADTERAALERGAAHEGGHGQS
jgi:hypothetical protein